MNVIADLHIHGRYSRGCSTQLDIAHLEKYARIKGLNILGTGDFTHPKWLEEIEKNLTEDEHGILRTNNGFPFLLQTEISLIYTQDSKGRRVHNVVLAPNLEVVKQIIAALLKKGRVDYDGRPIFKISCAEFVEMLRQISEDIEVIPAHIWTPWFSLFGSNSGFNSVEEAFQDQTKYIHAIETGLSCYDGKTEVLTKEGWKKFSKIKYDDEICALNTQTDKIDYQNPIRVFCYKYKGKMYRLKTKRVDLLVTPNHKLLVSHCDFRQSPRFLLKKAEFIFNKSKRLKKNGSWKGKNQQFFILPAVKIKHGSRYYSGLRNKKEKKISIKLWLKFFGFWIAEGWTTQGKNGDYNVCLSNNNKLLLSEMKQILQSFGYNVYHDDKKNSIIRVRDYQLFHYLKQFGKSYDKHIPLELKSLSKELLSILLEYYIKGDGHTYGRSGKGLSATTSSIRLRDDLQEIALKIGISAYYKLHNKRGTPFLSPSQGKIYRQREDTWVIYFIRQNIHTILPSTIKKYNHNESWINFDGNVYCVAVPNQVIYVRRNGIPVWCGNSDPPMNWRLSKLDSYNLVSFSDSHSYWPWRIGREATKFDIKELTYKNIIKAIRTSKGLTGTVEVDPNFGKYHLTGHRACSVCLEPKEALKLDNICPKCKNKLTVGVLQRVEELADRPEGFRPENAKDFKILIPLSEVLARVLGKGIATQATWKEYNNLVNAFDSEFEVLLNTTLEDLKRITNENVAKAILINRENKMGIKPGYDGVYGEPNFDGKQKKNQKTLGDF